MVMSTIKASKKFATIIEAATTYSAEGQTIYMRGKDGKQIEVAVAASPNQAKFIVIALNNFLVNKLNAIEVDLLLDQMVIEDFLREVFKQ